jgi:hypothetical protein
MMSWRSATSWLLKGLAPFQQRLRAQVLALQLQQIEDHVHRRGRHFVFGSSPQPLEAGDELAVEDGYFAVDDERRHVQLFDGLHRIRETSNFRLPIR